jgi:hypothetical protein
LYESNLIFDSLVVNGTGVFAGDLCDAKRWPVVVGVPNNGYYGWSSPSTLPGLYDASKMFYFKLSSSSGSGSSEQFALNLPSGSVSVDWVAQVLVAARPQNISDDGAKLPNNATIFVNWTVTNIDQSNNISIYYADCQTCACDRTTTGAVPSCSALKLIFQFEPTCLDEVAPALATSLPPTSMMTTLSGSLVSGNCYFFYIEASPRSDYNGRSATFGVSSEAIALDNVNIADWPLGETRTLTWEVLQDLRSRAPLCFARAQRLTRCACVRAQSDRRAARVRVQTRPARHRQRAARVVAADQSRRSHGYVHTAVDDRRTT